MASSSQNEVIQVVIQVAGKENNHQFLTSLQKNPPIKIYGHKMTFNGNYYLKLDKSALF